MSINKIIFFAGSAYSTVLYPILKMVALPVIALVSRVVYILTLSVTIAP